MAQPTPSPPSGETSGTVAAPDHTRQLQIQASSSSSSSSSLLEQEISTRPQVDGQGEALESHEVIELQTFSERKAWIQNKIRLLEKMPPIEVFVGLEAIKSSAEDVPGLPTRAELQKWLEEHDAIEKETEIFDTGELKKLRKFTRAATQRNLSPEDTDLIELTLTTIYDLDKLLHLLRDRSENLDLLGVRLTWEEHRKASWVDRRRIIADLKAFLESRAHWSPAVYENNAILEAATEDHRRGSIGSIASVSSEISINSPGFSRGTRFKLAELLSRDAASFASRVTSLRHGHVAASGKVLDKLIDNSRKPVPEELLDEQDKVEEKCINEMEAIGKFVMNAVMQWRKADEIYVETMKDKYAAQKLFDDIETALLQHPSARQSSSFMTRAEAILKRLYLRGNPSSPSSTFPRPHHPLFPEQNPFNEKIVEELSLEMNTTTELTRKAESLAKEYRKSYEAVNRVETLVESAAELIKTFNSVIDRLENGVSSGENDGSPPSLASAECLEPTRHSAFLALLPGISEELAKADQSSSELLRALPAALARISFPGIDPQFKADAVSELQNLTGLRSRARNVHEAVLDRVRKLREIRRIWSLMESTLKELELLRREVADEMDNSRWRQDSSNSVPGAPPTPESPLNVSLPLTSETGAEYGNRLSVLNNKVSQSIMHPLDSLAQSVENSLKQTLLRSADGLQDHCKTIQQMISLLQAIRRQTAQMKGVRDEFNDLQIRIDDATIRYERHVHAILNGEYAQPDLDTVIANESHSVQVAVNSFINSLPQRVPFVTPKSSLLSYIKRSFSSLDLLATLPQSNHAIEVPIDLQALDEAVRTDCNSYTVRLNGQVRALEQKPEHVFLARRAIELDEAVASAKKEVDEAASHLSTFRDQFAHVIEKGDISGPLKLLSQEVEQSSASDLSKIKHSLSVIHEIQERIGSTSRESRVYDTLLTSRNMAVSDAETSFAAWEVNIQTLRVQISDTHQGEQARLEQVRVEEERRLQAERERLAMEAAERERLEKERLEEEQRRLEVAARLEEEARVKAQKEEEMRLEKERLEAAEKRRIEEERASEERRVQAENERMAVEAQERARLERERQEMESKLKLTQERLEEERRIHAEKERMATEEAEKARLAREQLEEDHRRLQNQHKSSPSVTQDGEDVFGLVVPGEGSSQEMKDLAILISLRRRLRDIGFNNALSPGSALPGTTEAAKMRQELDSLTQAISSFPPTVDNSSVDLQLKSFRKDLQAASIMLTRVEDLASFSEIAAACDAALSDLLEHIDSYPSPPLGSLSSSYSCPSTLTPEEQLSGRISFTRTSINNMSNVFDTVKSDPRAVAEHDRVLQTWIELEEMGSDRISGRKSRPSSVISSRENSSGRSSSVSVVHPGHSKKKSSGFASLGIGSSQSRGKLGVPVPINARRAVSHSEDTPSRSDSRLSTRSFQRSTSGPLGGTLYHTTYASRQRTTSMTPSSPSTPRRPSVSSMRAPSVTQSKRSESPSISETSSIKSHSHAGRRRSSTSNSTWSRAPRLSFPSLPRASTPQKKTTPPRKKYVANPKSKLDVAVGDVVNNLPVGINIEGVSGSWKDQSGKYWIGDQDPKLCFCRILRSQTVMVRVGGGWMELSKFIRTHFADSFRLLSESPVINNTREEKWISSATLLESTVEINSPPGPPRTPEPRDPGLPSFALSPPIGNSPHSFRSSPSTKGSPLTPLQFMRRAEPEPHFLRPETPSRAPRTRITPLHSPVRNSVWRP
ncbi:hypothetical protein K435DRAFT_712976 [Dendrothele bispora CBS 962.96]|uniref:GAR domain-containing protein n=1 Tax=Dendrothele bispora (strain CBS 962.96) TaxID=1314807 RepID=A0A4S8MS59_DENBC|nr:hypothetical protein K435DRAFT_712976 [Dendrothele bispora CBS 962.96]